MAKARETKKYLANNFKTALSQYEVTAKELAQLTGWHVNLWTARTNAVTDIKLEDILVASKALRISPLKLAGLILEPPAADGRYQLILNELEEIRAGIEQLQERQMEAIGNAPRLQFDNSTAS